MCISVIRVPIDRSMDRSKVIYVQQRGALHDVRGEPNIHGTARIANNVVCPGLGGGMQIGPDKNYCSQASYDCRRLIKARFRLTKLGFGTVLVY